ncbi:hypothetical protein CsSME_00027863 [Camellia sinensis var. sinensis]
MALCISHFELCILNSSVLIANKQYIESHGLQTRKLVVLVLLLVGVVVLASQTCNGRDIVVTQRRICESQQTLVGFRGEDDSLEDCRGRSVPAPVYDRVSQQHQALPPPPL